MRKCYRTPWYRWISLSIFVGCLIIILSILIVDMTLDSCNDPYHDISLCLNSTSCDIRYCEPSICHDYICLPRIKKWCIHEEMIYFPEGNCPKHKLYKSAWVIFWTFIVVVIDFIIFIGTIIDGKCTQNYSEFYLDDDLAESILNNENAFLDECPICRGNSYECERCNGRGIVNKNDNYYDA